MANCFRFLWLVWLCPLCSNFQLQTFRITIQGMELLFEVFGPSNTFPGRFSASICFALLHLRHSRLLLGERMDYLFFQLYFPRSLNWAYSCCLLLMANEVQLDSLLLCICRQGWTRHLGLSLDSRLLVNRVILFQGVTLLSSLVYVHRQIDRCPSFDYFRCCVCDFGCCF